MFGKIMQEAREANGETQEQLALELNLSRQMVSHMEQERRKVPDDVGPKLIEKLDCGFVAMEYAHEKTGGAWVGKLDGEAVDLHRSSVKAKAIEELQEAIQALLHTCLVNKPDTSDKEKIQELKTLIMECIDVIVCLNHLVSVLCKDYGISFFKSWKDHKLKLISKGFVKMRRR